jgi:pyridoxal phosphate enzyme (YggS family)
LILSGRLEENLHRVRDRIRGARERSDRAAEDPVLVAVTKEVSIDDARALLGLGQLHLGENRVQEALQKIEALGPAPTWHLIGHLQSNKVRKAVGRFSWIHSVDSAGLLDRINRVAKEFGATPPRLCLQVNVTGEEAKHGFRPDRIRSVLASASALDGVEIAGLMTMARYAPDPETARPAFRALRQLRDAANAENWYRVPIPHLSMGMSGDFEVAVEEGATMLRVGSALFDRV